MAWVFESCASPTNQRLRMKREKGPFEKLQTLEQKKNLCRIGIEQFGASKSGEPTSGLPPKRPDVAAQKGTHVLAVEHLQGTNPQKERTTTTTGHFCWRLLLTGYPLQTKVGPKQNKKRGASKRGNPSWLKPGRDGPSAKV